MGEDDERLCDGVAEDQGLLTARSKLNGHMAQCEAAAFHRSPSIDRWDDATGSNLHEHLAGVNDPPPRAGDRRGRREALAQLAMETNGSLA
jgi:hypothetical protein